MRLTLVDNLVLPDRGRLDMLDIHPHLGLLSLAAVATADGHDVTIWDPKRAVRFGELPYDDSLYELSATRLLADRPEVIGFTTLGCSFLYTLGVARAVKRRQPELPILLGGPHATMLARPILERYPVFDVVVRHEAESTLPALLAELPTGSFDQIPGLTWRTAKGIEESAGRPRVDDLDTLPWLDYELYPMKTLGLQLIRVEAGRGCPFACTFCSTATFFQRRYRLKSPDRIVAEMNAVRDRYSPAEFKLDHDLFTVDRRKVEAFCEAVMDEGHHWHVSARADCVDDKLLEQMAAAGCVGLYLGVETGSRRMQKISAKRLDLDRVGPTLDACERLGIATTASFITGFPEEERADQNASLDLLGDCFSRPEVSCLPQLHILTPEPGTGLFDSFGAAMLFDGYATPFNSWLLGDSDREEVQRGPEIFASYHYYPGALPRREHIAAVESVDLLRSLGHAVLAALIDRHGGRLSVLIACLRAESDEDSTVPSAAVLEHYVRSRFGDDDPLTSVVRYRLFVSTPFQSGAKAEPRSVASDAFRSPIDLQILDDVMDQDEALAALSVTDAHRVPATRRKFSYLRWPAGPGPLMVDPPVAGLVQLFEGGRSLSDVLSLIGSTDQPDSALPRWVADLVDVGLLAEGVRVTVG